MKHAAGRVIHAGFALGLPLDPEIEEIYSTKTSIDFHRITHGIVPITVAAPSKT
jgi:hypothetical protein